MNEPATPYYLMDERKLLKNLKIIQRIRDKSGAKSVLALKCFSTWSVFDLMREYMDGTTSSGVYEARLGYEKFGKETHAYSVAFSPAEVREVKRYADKIIFNSTSQLLRFYPEVRRLQVGLRVNPGFSHSHFDLANPARKQCRLGVRNGDELRKVQDLLQGVMFHFNCENDDFPALARHLDLLSKEYGDVLNRLEWVSLGGGIYFTKAGYPVNDFIAKLKEFSDRHQVQVYLEPGEAAITQTCELVTTVLDVVHNEVEIAVVDAATETHFPDLLLYQLAPRLSSPAPGPHAVTIAGRTCLAGDVFGHYKLKTKLKPGSIVRIADTAGYTMVKKNWFNGVPMPSICVKRLSGKLDVVRTFDYRDFRDSLS